MFDKGTCTFRQTSLLCVCACTSCSASGVSPAAERVAGSCSGFRVCIVSALENMARACVSNCRSSAWSYFAALKGMYKVAVSLLAWIELIGPSHRLLAVELDCTERVRLQLLTYVVWPSSFHHAPSRVPLPFGHETRLAKSKNIRLGEFLDTTDITQSSVIISTHTFAVLKGGSKSTITTHNKFENGTTMFVC